MFSPTIWSSSSISFNFFSASSALSIALFSGHLKLLHVLTNHLEFLLNFLQLLLSKLSSVNCSLQRTSQAASCSHQPSGVPPQFPSTSSQQAQLCQLLSSADISSCFMFSPTIWSSSSISFNFFSASSALSIAL